MRLIQTDVLIVVEHRMRELENACLLKAAFERIGNSVIVDSIFPNKEILPIKYKAKIILLPWAYNEKDMKFIRCFYKYSPDAKIFNLHYEQYSGGEDSKSYLPSGSARNLFHLSGGKKFSDDLKKTGSKKARIFTVGEIKLDFYKDKLKKLSFDKQFLSKQFDISYEKPWFLFIANGYHLINHRELSKVRIHEQSVDIKAESAIQCRDDFLFFVNQYLEKVKDVVFIYRPHPVYSDKDKTSKDIIDLKKKYPNNFYVISDLSIRNWILASKACFSFHSTSVLECCIADIPYYLIRTKELPLENDYPFLIDYDYKIKNYEQFVDCLQGSIFSNQKIREKLSNYYVLDNQYAFQRVVDCVLTCNVMSAEKVEIREWVRLCIWAWIKCVLCFFSKNKYIKKYFVSRDDSRWFRVVGLGDDCFTQEEVIKETQKIRECLWNEV